MDTEKLRPLSVDGVVVYGSGSDGDLRVALMRRNHPPHEGDWVLPGGMVETDETAREACMREVEEEIGIKVETGEFVGLYDDPDRDERGNVSAAYICYPVSDDDPEPREEATEVDLFELDSETDLDGLSLGFDHAEILSDAVELLGSN